MNAPVRSSLHALAASLLAGAASTALCATITVSSTLDTTADDGVCTFREAVIAANTNTASGATAGECVAGAAGADTIHFNVPGIGVRTISLASVLPVITEPLTIDGYSQTGSSPNALTVGDNAVLLIRIDAGSLPNLQRILQFGPGSNGSNVTGLNIGNANGGVIFFNNVTGGSSPATSWVPTRRAARRSGTSRRSSSSSGPAGSPSGARRRPRATSCRRRPASAPARS